MSTPIKYAYSGLKNSPVLTGQAGSLIALLDAVLVDGWGAKVADSILVQNGVASVALSTGHSFEPDMIMLVSGAVTEALNGEKRVLTSSGVLVTFDATGVPDTNQVSGVLVKVAPAGWQRVFNSTNVSVYKSRDIGSTGMYLRVDDSGTTNARVRAYESMTDVNTGIAPFPIEAQKAGGGWWPKSNTASDAARAWMVVADGKTFYTNICTATVGNPQGGVTYGFGDFTSRRSGDPMACILFSGNVDSSNGLTENGESVEYFYFDTTSYYKSIPRSYTGYGGSVSVQTRSEYNASGGLASGGGSGNLMPYPNPIDNSITLSRIIILEPPSNGLRGYLRGVLGVMNQAHTSFQTGNKVPGSGDLIGRSIIFSKSGGAAASVSRGLIAFDVTGPWS